MMDAATLHARLSTLDSHIDIPWPWPEGEEPRRRSSLNQMRAGGVRAGCFAAYVPQGPTTPAGHAAARARADAMLDRIARMAEADDGARLAGTADAIEAAWRDGALAVVPAVENGTALGEDLSALADWRRRGVAYVTLCHNGHNLLTDSSNPRADLGDGATRHDGLSPLGCEAIAEMNRLGILVDVSHASRAAMLGAARHSRTPVVATHSCVRALCDHPRNLDDLQLDALREAEGVVQITAVAPFLRRGAKPEAVGVGDFCDHIDYAVKRCGVAHVGIGSDFDGGGGFAGWETAADSAAVTAELVRRGYGESEIALFWGGNFLRLMRQAEAAAEPGAP